MRVAKDVWFINEMYVQYCMDVCMYIACEVFEAA